MSISSKRSTVRPVELSQSVVPEEMLAVEELSVMQGADVLDMEAREQASKQSAEDEALQVAQVNMPTEYLENPAAAAEVMSDVGEAGLLGEESISRWEAQEVAFAGAGGGAGAGFWGGMGGFGAAAGGIAVGGKLHQNSMDSSDQGGGDTVDTSVVIFDLVGGVSSDHSSRTFDSATTYTIYIRVDSNGAAMESVPQPGSAGTWGVWSGADNLGADDTIVLVGTGTPILNVAQTTEITTANLYSSTSAITWGYAGSMSAVQTSSWGNWFLSDTGTLLRSFSTSIAPSSILGTSSLDLWTGTYVSIGVSRTLGTAYMQGMPANMLTSQGLT